MNDVSKSALARDDSEDIVLYFIRAKLETEKAAQPLFGVS
jgi:hypothetical protein